MSTNTVKRRYSPPELVGYGPLEAITGMPLVNCPSGGDLVKPTGGFDDTLTQQDDQVCN